MNWVYKCYSFPSREKYLELLGVAGYLSDGEPNLPSSMAVLEGGEVRPPEGEEAEPYPGWIVVVAWGRDELESFQPFAVKYQPGFPFFAGIDPYERKEVPESVTMLQAQALLFSTPPMPGPVPGDTLLDQIEFLVEQKGGLAKLAWTRGANFHKDSPTTNELRKALGISDDQLDEMLIAASKINL